MGRGGGGGEVAELCTSEYVRQFLANTIRGTSVPRTDAWQIAAHRERNPRYRGINDPRQ